MLAGMVHISGSLVGSRQSELRRSVERIQFQCVFERINRRWKLLGLHVHRAQKIPGVSVVRVDLYHSLERVNRRLRVAHVLGQHPEAVPCVGTLRILFERIFQPGLGIIDLLQIQIRNALVQPCNRELRIGLRGLLEVLQSLLKELLVHIGDAQVVQARGFNRIGL